jgi:hypothetical protein
MAHELMESEIKNERFTLIAEIVFFVTFWMPWLMHSTWNDLKFMQNLLKYSGDWIGLFRMFFNKEKIIASNCKSFYSETPIQIRRLKTNWKLISRHSPYKRHFEIVKICNFSISILCVTNNWTGFIVLKNRFLFFFSKLLMNRHFF